MRLDYLQNRLERIVLKNNKMSIVNHKYIALILVLGIFLMGCSDASAPKKIADTSSFFDKGDRVCFVGNSITDMGMFHNNIYLYHITRFLDKPIKVYNLGISGDVTTGVLNRMEDDIMIHKPTHAVIMLGMNDVQRNLYGAKTTTNNDTLYKRQEAIHIYKKNLDSIVNIFLSKNVQVILERPSIYDQTATLSEPNHLGVNGVLGECGIFIDSLAGKYQLQVVDYFSTMNRINTEIQTKDSSATLTSKDRIHPEETGHFVMTYEFLRTEKASKYISKIVIDARDLKSLEESYNCHISAITKQKNKIEFDVKEMALPFPVNREQQEALKLVPFVDDFNVELFKVRNLTNGEYRLQIDNVVVGIFSSEQLDEGVNLATYKLIPQFQQAKEVREKLEELWEMEGKLRGMKFIEYMDVYKSCPKKESLDYVESFLDSIFSGYPDPYYKDQLKTYVQNKPKEEKLTIACAIIRKEIYSLAKPKKHLFTLQLK